MALLSRWLTYLPQPHRPPVPLHQSPFGIEHNRADHNQDALNLNGPPGGDQRWNTRNSSRPRMAGGEDPGS